MSLRTKIFVFSAGMMAVVVLMTLVLVQHRIRGLTLAEAESDLQVAVTAVEQLAEDRFRSRRLQAELLAQVSPLRDALERRDRRELEAALEDLYRHLAENELILVADPEGNLIAAQGDPLLVPDGSLSNVEPIRSLWRRQEPRAVWILEGRLLEVIALPLESKMDGRPVGALILGMTVGNSLADRLHRLTQSEVLILADQDVVGSSLPETVTRSVARQYAQLPPDRSHLVTVQGEPLLARIQVVDVDYGGLQCIHIVLRSLRGAMELAEGIQRDLLIIGLSAAVLAFLAAWLGAREIASPLRRAAETLARMAHTGHLQGDFPSSGNGRELRLFEETFRHLLHSLEESQRDREQSYVEAVGAVVAAIDARDHDTTGHSFRVAYYAVALARMMGVDRETQRAIEWGALLHDIGKIAVPDAILRKVGPLTEAEWHIMHQHPSWGYEILADVKFLQPALGIVYSHHERWDGKGYPRGLKGEEIPLSARIFAVVDTYDSITSDRPYRRARSHQVAIAELRRVAGTQLDPRCVEAFLRISEVQLRRLREISSRTEVNLRLPSDLLEWETEARRKTS